VISVAICTHNPRPALFGRCLSALRTQAGSAEPWEVLVIDNASGTPLTEAGLTTLAGGPFSVPFRVVREAKVGLIHARETALREARGDTLLFVDDDNLLDPSYLVSASRFLTAHPEAGIVGGRSRGEYESPPPRWFPRVAEYLAVRDLGPQCERADRDLPFGAGMVVRRKCYDQALKTPFLLTGRKGNQVVSGEDTELCIRAGRDGWQVWYDGSLQFVHYMESRRLTLEYQRKLQHGFGLARPYIELYQTTDARNRRSACLRRAFGHWRKARTASKSLPGAIHTDADLEAHLAQAFEMGLAHGLWTLATGPAVWKAIEKHYQTRGVA